MVEVNLKEYARILYEKTVSGEYVWESSGDKKYRLLMNKGSVTLLKDYSTIESWYYCINFYGTSTLIYSATIKKNDVIYSDYKALYETIISKNNEKINNQISELFT